MGKKGSELFSWIDTQPIAAASLAQVSTYGLNIASRVAEAAVVLRVVALRVVALWLSSVVTLHVHVRRKRTVCWS